MPDKSYSQKELNKLKVTDTPHQLHPDYSCNNYFVIATANGMGDLEQKARDGFKEADLLPDYVYIPEKHELKVGDTTVHYALVCGVYSR